MIPIDVNFDYDKEGDVLYISFGTGEPSYCEEVDDMLLVERGVITNAITGFRILDIRHHKIESVEVWVQKMEKIVKRARPPFKNAYLDTLRQPSVRNKLKKYIHA